VVTPPGIAVAVVAEGPVEYAESAVEESVRECVGVVVAGGGKRSNVLGLRVPSIKVEKLAALSLPPKTYNFVPSRLAVL